MIQIKEIVDELNKKLPAGYVLIVAPENKNTTVFGVYKFNPNRWIVAELIEKMCHKLGNWIGGGNLN